MTGRLGHCDTHIDDQLDDVVEAAAPAHVHQEVHHCPHVGSGVTHYALHLQKDMRQNILWNDLHIA